MIIGFLWVGRIARCGHKKAAGGVATCGDFVIQSLSQPQVHTRRPKVKVLAAQGVADLLTAPMHG